MLAVAVGHRGSPKSFECGRDRAIQTLMASESLARGLDIAHSICGSQRLIAPAKFCVPSKIAGGTGITSVEEPANESHLVATGASGTLEDVGFAAVEILDSGCGFEESVHWCIPAFGEAIYRGFSKSAR